MCVGLTKPVHRVHSTFEYVEKGVHNPILQRVSTSPVNTLKCSDNLQSTTVEIVSLVFGEGG